MIKLCTPNGEYGLAFSYEQVPVMKDYQYILNKNGEAKRVEETTITIVKIEGEAETLLTEASVRPHPSDAPNRSKGQMYAFLKAVKRLGRQTSGELKQAWFTRMKQIAVQKKQMRADAMKLYQQCLRDAKEQATEAEA
jgi:hypothetical protein